ncbi:MAG TPA: DUF1343 domain-containing protein [Cytophagaceae bacterium]|nr:DUF1343 domain-containing protein [Cytophagaceae bacterium]
MKQKTVLLLSILFLLFSVSLKAQEKIVMGAGQPELYLALLRNKNVALMVNPSSLVGKTHLVDTLLSSGVKIKKIFSPEHGFRGTADAGEKIQNDVDAKTGIPLVSLYGDHKKPTREELKDVDLIIFDLQDVGARFFTYISSMHYLMQACADHGKKMIVLDRPNPNGYYIDGPVLDLKYRSFVGMHPIPVVHGLTVGELAKMINGEKWLDSGKVCDLTVIPMKNYTHKTLYSLPVKPSPNLPNDLAIYFYPSLCLFEGTVISVGRGTESPFQLYGAPKKEYGNFEFTPKSTEGAKKPLYENQVCYGTDLRKIYPDMKFHLSYLIDAYQRSPEKDKFFNNFFNKLAGNATLQEQIKKGMKEEEIKKSWQPELERYRKMRVKYLLYQDFN